MNTAATDVWLNSGPGQRLDGGTNSKGPGKDGRDSGGAGMMSAEDMQLAMAIRASMGGGGGAEGGGEGEDEMARAIALSLSQEESASSSPGERRVVGGCLIYISFHFLVGFLSQAV